MAVGNTERQLGQHAVLPLPSDSATRGQTRSECRTKSDPIVRRMTGPVIPTHDRSINSGLRFPFERIQKVAAAEVEKSAFG